MKKITTAQENYIKSIYELSLQGEGVRITDIANKFGVSKASAHTMVNTLQNESLVRHDKYNLVYLTDEGRKQALNVSARFSIIFEFLVNVVRVDSRTARTEAGGLEHLVSEETLCALCRHTNKKECHDQCAIPQS
jgi:Mn-dependent DtxR family transcriptional regulator